MFDSVPVATAFSDVLSGSGLAGRWWVAHTRSRHEKVLAETLRRFDIPYYLPLCPRATRSPRSGRVSRSLVPLFPGYLFFVADDEQRHRALTTNHIAQTIAVTDQTALLHQLRQIDLAIRNGETLARSGRLAAGDRVRVVAGPLMGLEGIVARWKSRVRVVLNVEILGQAASVEVDSDLLERIE
jgi:transcriptional antiterminator NusG